LAHRQNPKKCCVPASPDQRAPGHKVPEFQFKSVSSASIWGGHVGQAIDLVKEHLDLILLSCGPAVTSGLTGPAFALCMLTCDFATMVAGLAATSFLVSFHPALCDRANGRKTDRAGAGHPRSCCLF
jgi:hypothetical protein